MMEIVHDLAPGAPLLFYGTAGATSLDAAAAIASLAASGARVIVDDVTFTDQPTFAVFVSGTGSAVAFDPKGNRIFFRLRDAGQVTRGATSVAMRTQ